MSPVAVEALGLSAPESKAAVPAKGNALVIGSLTTAQDGSYQKLVENLEGGRVVERQMVDRIVDQGM